MARILCIFVLSADIIAGETPARDLVDAIRENLRRNNDDYIESSTLNSSLSTTITGQTNTTASTKHSSSDSDGNSKRTRTKNISSITDNTSATKYAIQRRKFNHLQYEYNFNKDKLVLPLSTRNNIKHDLKVSVVKKAKLGTTRKPIGSVPTENLIQISQNNIPNEQSAKANNISISSMFVNKEKDSLVKPMQKNRLEMRSKYETVSKAMHGLRNSFRGVFGSESESERSPPAQKAPPTAAAADLDMAPAKGSRVHSMRLRGRLCQRSVLMPEGPKYDSSGRIYLGAHSGGRDYSRTRRPALLLPRCCNCCRKSVLGCD